jgi:hypothetical protein
MKIEIMVFKPSGKYYTDEVVENEKDIYLFEDEFKKFVYMNLPAKMDSAYIVVRDVNEGDQSFHIAHYNYDDLVDFIYNKYPELLTK